MKQALLASAVLALPLGFSACTTAGLSESQQVAAANNEQLSGINQQEVDTLNRLTRIYIDAAALYKQAADIPDEQNQLRDALAELAQEKNRQRDMLQERVLAIGGVPAERGQALGTMHRSFTSLRTVIDDDTEVAVEEVLRGERYIRDEIDKAMTAATTPATKNLLARLRTDADARIARLEATDDAV